MHGWFKNSAVDLSDFVCPLVPVVTGPASTASPLGTAAAVPCQLQQLALAVPGSLSPYCVAKFLVKHQGYSAWQCSIHAPKDYASVVLKTFSSLRQI